MVIRKLEQQEHYKTRVLYETVFSEDDEKFVDYYYTWKIRDNTIYVAEDEEGIHSMIHLNPFDVWVDGQVQKLHYIVAVATQEEYRHRGLMRRLLQAVEKEMKENGEVFTFLMPASEKIYYPFGYRFFVGQRRGMLCAACGPGVSLETLSQSLKTGNEGQTYQADREMPLRAAEISRSDQYICRPVYPEEYGKLADFVNDALKNQYDVFVYRNAAYYERLCAEQSGQNGAVMVVIRGAEDGREEIVGTFCTTLECEFMIRELILEPEYLEESRNAVYEYAESYKDCKVYGMNCEGLLKEETWNLLMMGKVPGGDAFQSCWAEKKIFINEIV